MQRAHLAAVILAVAALLAGGVAHAQARGPAVEEIQENGQDILTRQERREAAALQVREQAEKEQQALRDPAIRARKLAELDTWFRRIPGRFRIDGLIEAPAGDQFNKVSDKVTGVADCTGIGEGVGVQCIFSATWRTIEPGVEKIGAPPPPSEMLRTFTPAVLVLGLNLDPPGIRAQMVNADSLSHTWVGKLAESAARVNRINRSLPLRHIQSLEIIAEPDSEVLTIVMRAGAITLTLTMYHDAEVHADKPLKPLRAR